MTDDKSINPFNWSRKYKIAFIAVALMGALIGIIWGFSIFSLHSAPETFAGTLFSLWLKMPIRAAWWPWPLFGAAITSLWFYFKRIQ